MNDTTKKTTFITVVSWILIVFSGLGTIISLMQNIVFFLLEGFNSFDEHDHGFFLDNMGTIFLIFFALVSYSFVSSIGLLKRKNWARKSYIVLFGIGILYFIGCTLFLWLFDTLKSNMDNSETRFDLMLSILKIFYTIFLLGLSTLFGWLIKKLMSEKIITEFKHPS